MSLFVGAAVLVILSAVVFFLQVSTRINRVIFKEDQSLQIAQSGASQTIGRLKANNRLQDWDAAILDVNGIQGDGLPGAPDLPYPGDATFYRIDEAANPRIIYDRSESDPNKKELGRYYSKAKQVFYPPNPMVPAYTPPFADSVFYIVTKGWSTTKSHYLDNVEGIELRETTVHTYVRLSSANNYFLAIKGPCQIGPGADMTNAEVYCQDVGFSNLPNAGNPNPNNNPTSVKAVHYAQDLSPNPWPATINNVFPDLQNDNCSILIGEINPSHTLYSPADCVARRAENCPMGPNCPKQLTAATPQKPPTFPPINEEVDYYANLPDTHVPGEESPISKKIPPTPPASPLVPPNPPGPTCDIQGIILKPPSMDNNFGFSATGDNRDHFFYCDAAEGVKIGDIVVEGQVVIAAKKFRIIGDIYIQDGTSKSNNPVTWSPPESTINENTSTAHQLVLLSKGSVIIERTFNTNNTFNFDGNPNLLTLQAYIVAPEGTLQWGQGYTIAIGNTRKLNINGAMILSTQPKLKDMFNDLPDGVTDLIPARSYSYMETLKTDPPPLRFLAEILYQFEQSR